MNGIEKLHSKNHTLYIEVQQMINRRMSWEDICDKVGLVGQRRVMELTEWFLAYKTPKTEKPAVRRSDAVYVGPSSRTPQQMSAAFLAWKRQHEGVKATLREGGFEPSAE
jgi:hypothetical protein